MICFNIHTVHYNVFSTWNKLMILVISLEGTAIWKPGLKEWNVFLNELLVYKECCNTSNFTVCKFKHLFRSQNFSRGINLFKVTANTITSRKTWKPMQESFYDDEQSILGSAFLEPIATPRHTCKADILKGCSLGLTQINWTYFGSHLASGLYIYILMW